MNPLELAFESYNEKRPTAFIVKLKRNKNGELDELIRLTSFLDIHYDFPHLTQRVKHYASNDFRIKECPICKNPLSYRAKPNPNYLKTCGSEECNKKQNHLSTKEAIRKKYGVENISQTPEWRDKVTKTNLERRGVEWNTQTKECREKNLEKFKTSKDEIISKRRETCIEKYGVSHHYNSQEVNSKLRETLKTSYAFNVSRIEKIKETQFDKYGSYFCSTAECQDKKYQRKDYTFPSGRVVKVQGYEPKCIDELLREGHREEDIITGNSEIEKCIGKILYRDDNNEERRYFPDIYLPSQNLLIEVKSDYTLSQDTFIEKKKQAVIDSGFTYSLRVY